MDEGFKESIRNQVVFVDTETTGLDHELHSIWEVCIGEWNGTDWVLDSRQIQHDLSFADPRALDLNHYWERFQPGCAQHPQDVARWVMRRTWGMRIVGVNPTFDILGLTSLLRENHAVPGWHYHPLDLPSLIFGFLLGMEQNISLSWNSHDLSEILGVPRDSDTAHTAQGDVRWAIDQMEELMRPPWPEDRRPKIDVNN